MDGSAKICRGMLNLVFKFQIGRKVLEITEAVNYTNSYRDIDIHVIPSDRFRITWLNIRYSIGNSV